MLGMLTVLELSKISATEDGTDLATTPHWPARVRSTSLTMKTAPASWRCQNSIIVAPTQLTNKHTTVRSGLVLVLRRSNADGGLNIENTTKKPLRASSNSTPQRQNTHCSWFETVLYLYSNYKYRWRCWIENITPKTINISSVRTPLSSSIKGLLPA